MTQDKDKQDFEDYLKGDSELSRRYRVSSGQLPANYLDDAIKAAARNEITSHSNKVLNPFTRSWYVPVSLVAVLVLCIGLVFNIYQDSGQELLTAPAATKSVDEFDSLPSLEARGASDNPMRNKKYDDVVLPEEIPAQDKIGPNEQRQDVLTTREPASTSEMAPASAPLAAPAPALKRELSDMGTTVKEKQSEIDASKPEDVEMIWQKKQLEEAEPKTLHDVEDMSLKSERSEAMARFESNYTSPEQWLEDINELWEQGNKDTAMTSLDHFIQTYPEYSRSLLRNKLNQDIEIPELGE